MHVAPHESSPQVQRAAPGQLLAGGAGLTRGVTARYGIASRSKLLAANSGLSRSGLLVGKAINRRDPGSHSISEADDRAARYSLGSRTTELGLELGFEAKLEWHRLDPPPKLPGDGIPIARRPLALVEAALRNTHDTLLMSCAQRIAATHPHPGQLALDSCLAAGPRMPLALDVVAVWPDRREGHYAGYVCSPAPS